MLEILELEFMQNAIVAGVLVSIACGIIGSLVVINRMVFIAGGIAHGAYGGLGIAFYFSLEPLLGAKATAKVEVDVLGAAEPAKALERIAARATAGRPANAGVTELVVALAFLLVFQHFVGFIDLFKFGLITALFIRVILHRRLTKGLLDLILRGRFRHT